MPLEALQFDITPTELHYVLTHFDIPFIDSRSWRLSVGGNVARPLSLTLDEIRARASVSSPITLECAGNGRALLSRKTDSWMPWLYGACSTAEWTGAPLGPLLDEAGVLDEAVEVLFTGADRGIEDGIVQHFERSLPLTEASRPEVLLAYEMNGVPLPARHGFPLRLVAPGWYGMASVKWLERITVLDEPHTGYMQTSFVMQQRDDDPGILVSRMAPRSLMVRPGMLNDDGVRELDSVDLHVRGRAWSGWGPIERVEVSLDGGATWGDARLEPLGSAFAWVGWTFEAALPGGGSYELCSRATDTSGNVQPVEESWNLGGFANNAVERVRVMVAPGQGG
ncbi:MAG TPA: sulfite oxidase [Actinomycetota bacterium]|nr:sulfite oxidase [Actinomycetota bacterium]